jgi:hypothetical protein
MRLLHLSSTGGLSFSKELVGDDTIPPYAILSHTWGADTEEISYGDLMNNTGRDKPGYKKILSCGEQARRDGLPYFWVDTCCINKADNTELSYAINSMFRWYRNATVCYVYLADTASPDFDDNNPLDPEAWATELANSRWFTRGWTLQELIAPQTVEFYFDQWKRLGNKRSLEQQLHRITGIPKLALHNGPLAQFSPQERLSWMEDRRTKREEDLAYSLLGIFHVSMPLIYGEGKGNAFRRLQEEIEKSTRNQPPYNTPSHTSWSSPPEAPPEDSTRGNLSENLWILGEIATQLIFVRYFFYHWFGEDRDAVLRSFVLGSCMNSLYNHYYKDRLPLVLHLIRHMFIQLFCTGLV